MFIACLALAVELGSVSVELRKEDETLRPAFERYAADAERKIVDYFGSGFKKNVVIHVLPNRKAFDKALHDRWKMKPTQPWMVGAAGADVLFMLSPRVWKSEAQEHNPDDAREISEIVCHELVHSYHAQSNPTKDMEGLDEMAWFVEGLATFVSGQLDRNHRGVAVREIVAGRVPKSLEEAWRGRWRYSVAGSMVKFVDARFGRKEVLAMLALTSNEAALKAIGLCQEEFLAKWQAWARENSSGN